MLIKERHRLIAEWVNQKRGITRKELSERLSVSEMTIWRDLKILEGKGVINRVRGGAIGTSGENGYKMSLEPEFEVKQDIHRQEKIQIARYSATHFVEDGDIIILEGGTTVANMIPFLNQARLTVLTNGLNVLKLAANLVPNLTLISCGGLLREISHTFVGPQTERFFAEMRAKKLFISATGLTLDGGLTDPNPLEIQVKNTMRRSAEKTILLLDSSKFGTQSLTPIMSLHEIDVLITDPGAPTDILDELRQVGVDVHLAHS
jgi:DeoR/GlpR family transcriptional regulator of sugar metabolism